MYAKYSTVSDSLESGLIAVTPDQQIFIEHPEMIPDDQYDVDVLSEAMLSAPPISGALHAMPEEIVQCEVLRYPAEPWASQAKRIGTVGVVTGLKHSEEYCGEWEDEARAMDQQMNVEIKGNRMKARPWWQVWR
jgi:hypothetical protein